MEVKERSCLRTVAERETFAVSAIDVISDRNVDKTGEDVVLNGCEVFEATVGDKVSRDRDVFVSASMSLLEKIFGVWDDGDEEEEEKEERGGLEVDADVDVDAAMPSPCKM